MSTLVVLQSFPMQHTSLLSMIEEEDASIQIIMKFDATDVKPHLLYHVSFQIDIVYVKHVIRMNDINEGASTCVMYFSCWKVIGSPELPPSPTLLTSFEKHLFIPHKLISSFPFHLGGKFVSIEVEVVDALLNYNILLGRSWNYAMTVVISSIFQILCFPREGRFVTIN